MHIVNHDCDSLLPSMQAFTHSSIGSSEKSARRSAPQTDHRFLSLLLLRALPLISREPRRLNSAESASPISALYFASSSAARRAASSASGVSSMVSSELIDGDLDLKELGVLGMLEAEPKLNELEYGSLL